MLSYIPPLFLVSQMKIIDAFIFYNELELLEYRLSVLYDVVDHFVLVESTRTHAGKEKTLFYAENEARFAKYADKIIHVVDRDLLENPKHDYTRGRKDEVWYNENHQRKSIDTGLKQLDLDDRDLIIVSDVDEIPDPRMLTELKASDRNIAYAGLCQDFYYYNLTYKNTSEDWRFAKIVSYQHYVNVFDRNPQCCRDIPADRNIRPAGWHLSYFGDSRFIKNKIEQFAHQEFNRTTFTNSENIEESIKTGKDLFMRSYERCSYIPLHENRYLPPNHTYFDHLIISDTHDKIDTQK